MNQLNYHHLHYFWVVCNEGSFTKAAQKLRISQSAVSEQIKQLEHILGQKLIERTTRRIEMTKSGSIAYQYANTIFESGQELVDFMLNRPSVGKQIIRIGALGSLSRNLQLRFLSPLLERSDVRFHVTIGDSSRLFRGLKDHSLDVVLSSFPAPEEETGELYSHHLTRSPLCVVKVARSKTTRKQKLAELFKKEKVFLPSHHLSCRADFDLYVSTHALELNIAGEVDDVALLRLLAMSGKGLVVVPKMGVLNEIKNQSLQILHEFQSIQQPIYAITKQKRIPNLMIASLIKNTYL